MKKSSTFNAAERERQLAKTSTMKEEDINTKAADPHVIREDQLPSARPFHEIFRALKTAISLRVDNDVLDYYKQQGEGYQTRMNAALRAQMEAERAPEPDTHTL